MDWIHELAKNELNPEAANIFNSTNRFDPKQIIEENTIEFLNSLRDLFTVHCKAFNGYSNNNEKFSEIKIYGISQTPADFMLFRNNVKLVFSNTAHGIVNAAFTQHVQGGVLSPSQSQNPSQAHDIIAQVGPFLDVSWTFQGEKINPERLVKYYLVEFVKLSRVDKKVSPNQLLLKQIKALLQDQGINL